MASPHKRQNTTKFYAHSESPTDIMSLLPSQPEAASSDSTRIDELTSPA